MGALDQIVRSGKALYVGISQYKAEETARAAELLKAMGTPFLIHQPRYNMMDRWVEENKLLDTLERVGVGSIVFSPLEQGILTGKYLNGIPKIRAQRLRKLPQRRSNNSRSGRTGQKLNEIAENRNQSLAQMAIAWLLKDQRVTSVLVGASKVDQLKNNVEALNNLDFTENELQKIEGILK